MRRPRLRAARPRHPAAACRPPAILYCRTWIALPRTWAPSLPSTGSAQPPPLPPGGASSGQSSSGNDITKNPSAAAVATWGGRPGQSRVAAAVCPSGLYVGERVRAKCVRLGAAEHERVIAITLGVDARDRLLTRHCEEDSFEFRSCLPKRYADPPEPPDACRSVRFPARAGFSPRTSTHRPRRRSVFSHVFLFCVAGATFVEKMQHAVA